MMIDRYQLSPASTDANKNAAAWLKLGVVSLIAAGLFSILLVLSRTPAIQSFIPFIDFFHIALVVHVDLSVLIWFLSCASILWSLIVPGDKTIADRLALWLAIAGTVMITLAPFIGIGSPLMNNYVPILDHPFYLLGLGVFGCGIFVQLLRTTVSGWPGLHIRSTQDAMTAIIYLSALLTLAAIVALLVSYLSIPPAVTGHAFYEVLFWGPGHILQFSYTVILLLAWLWIADATGAQINLSPKIIALLGALVALPVLHAVGIYLQHDVVSGEHRLGFTNLMKYGGLSSLPLGLLITWAILRAPPCPADKRPVKAALFSSIFLFAAGGIIGFLIEGVNVVIPAHYHGSIVGVTLALMGLAYHLLPQFGFTQPTSKMARWQPYVYGGGQLMHILGLAWSGGYGVQRKTAGAAQGLENLPEIVGMGMMGLGGAISIIGGILFVIVMIKSFLKRPIA